MRNDFRMSVPVTALMCQPNLFEGSPSRSVDDEHLMLYALGEFQARGKALAERELPLDRLRGAVRRACEVFGSDMLEDGSVVTTLNRLGAQVKQVPSFIAKHPFRITVPTSLAERARLYYEEVLSAATK